MNVHRWVRSAGIAAAVVLAIAALVFGLLQTGIGRGLVAAAIESAASSDTLHLKVEGLEGTLPGSPRVAKLTIADAHGPWLVLHDVRLSWSPISLIFGNIVVDDASIARVDWLRQPATGEAKSSDDADEMPALSIARLHVATVAIARDVAGTPGLLTLDGAVDALDPSRTTMVAINAIEIGGGARFDGDFRYSREDSVLVAKLDIQDRAGGVLGGLAGLPSDAPLSVQMTSEGTIDDWHARLVAKGGAALDANGTAAVRREGVQRRFTAALTGQFGSIGPVSWRSLIQGRIRLSLAGAVGDEGGMRLDALELESTALRLQASGVFDPSAEKASGYAALVIPEGRRVAPLLDQDVAWRDLNATARLAGPWPKPVLDIDMSASDVSVGDLAAATLALNARLGPDRRWDESGLRLAVTVRANADGVDSADATVKRLLGPRIALTAQGALEAFTRVSNASLELSAAAGVVRFTGDLDNDALAGELAVDSANLVSAGSTGGRAQLRAQINLERATSAWRIEGAGSTQDVAIGERVVDDLLKGRAEVAFAARGSSLGQAIISKLSFGAPRVVADVDGSISAEKLDLNAKLVVPDMTVVSGDIGGRGDAQLRIDGTLRKPRANGTVSLARGRVLDQGSQLLLLRLTEADAEGIAELSLNGDLGGKAVAANAAVVWNDTAGVRLNALHMALGSVALDGGLVVDDNGLLDGALALKAGSLQDVAPLLDVDLAGRGSGTFVFSRPNRHQALTVALKSEDARVDAARMSGVSVTGRLFDPFGVLDLDLRLQTASADIDGFALTRVDATARGTLRALDVSAKAMRGETSVAAEARLDSDRQPTRIALRALSLVRGERSARLAAPMDLTVSGGAVSMTSARINAGDGQLTASGTAGRTMNLALKAEGIPLWVGDLLGDPLPVSGAASGTVTLHGAARERRSTFDVKIVGLTPQDARDVARNLTLVATGTGDRNAAQLEATLSDPRGTTLKASGRVPLSDSGAFALDVQGTAELALANAYLSATGDRARGKLALSAKISGTLAAPRVAGGGTIKDGFFRSALAGLELRDVTARLEGDERRIAVNALSAKTPNGGTVNGRGEIRLDRAGGFPIDISLKAAGAQLVATNITTVVAGLDVRMNGGLMRSPVIEGNVDIEQWDIRVPERLARPLTPIRVTHRNAPTHIDEAGPSPERVEAESALSFGLDLAVRAPRRVFVRGQGIDAEFGGNAKVTGSVDDPIVRGRFDLKRGTISLLSERVALTRGDVVFSGGVEPTLDVAGTISKSDLTATISAKGKASDPVLSLTSTPSLPQDEILSRILFSKGTQQLSAFEAAQLAQTIAKWSGLSAGPDILDKLRTALGIDALSATTDAKGGTAVSAGSYVGSGVFLGMTQGAATQSGAANVEVELDDHIKLKGEAGASGNAKIGVAAEWEY